MPVLTKRLNHSYQTSTSNQYSGLMHAYSVKLLKSKNEKWRKIIVAYRDIFFVKNLIL